MNTETNRLIGIFDRDGHLTPAAQSAMRDGTLCDDALLRALEHLAVCGRCAEAYAEGFAEDTLADAPTDFYEQLVPKLWDPRSRRRAFALYVARVVVAASIALFITFSGALSHSAGKDYKAADVKAPSFGFLNSITEQLRNFSQNLLNMEVKIHDKAAQ